jgi:osmotically inducible lipoprotein OsmB
MTSGDNNPNATKKANHMIFAGLGAVLGGVAGAGMAGVVTAAVGAVVGGLVGYNILKRL